jgi:hypothetical protein
VALLCLSLAWADGAAAGDNAADQPQGQETIAGEAAPKADGAPAALAGPSGAFAFNDIDMSTLMSRLGLEGPFEPGPSLMMPCDFMCCVDLPLGGVLCCSRWAGRCVVG